MSPSLWFSLPRQHYDHQVGWFCPALENANGKIEEFRMNGETLPLEMVHIDGLYIRLINFVEADIGEAAVKVSVKTRRKIETQVSSSLIALAGTMITAAVLYVNGPRSESKVIQNGPMKPNINIAVHSPSQTGNVPAVHAGPKVIVDMPKRVKGPESGLVRPVSAPDVSKPTQQVISTPIKNPTPSVPVNFPIPVLRQSISFEDAQKLYAKGKFTEAAEQFAILSDEGNKQAQFQLGNLCRTGNGTPKDLPRALLLYRKAAEAGLSMAQHNLAVMYQNGEGVVKDENEARKWYTQAAQNGYLPSQRALQNGEQN